MNGLELSRAYFEAYGLPMLKAQFPSLLPLLCAGLTGAGSECYGFDDEISRDHDFEPGFCLFLPGEETVSRRDAFLLERAYAKLPREFMGFQRGLIAPVGGPRRGVLRMDGFFMEKVGAPDGALSPMQWLSTPDYALAEAVNGEIFLDGPGDMTRIRAALSRYPEDIRKKKLAGHLLLAAQAGQYNYGRCLGHRETAAAQLAVCAFVQHAMQAVFLLNRVYMPYYKWSFRAMRGLPRLSLLAELMEYLLTTDNGEELSSDKQDVMEGMIADIIGEMRNQRLTKAVCGDLEKHAYSVQDLIEDTQVRSMHILCAV
ncbi:MAG: DUF4037 domain-containing protein [Clostridia bacterium]|nr:DUF4037 domain-containing protein [Clostridia bacterium]